MGKEREGGTEIDENDFEITRFGLIKIKNNCKSFWMDNQIEK